MTGQPVGPMLRTGFDEVWERVRGRMDGLTDEEYLWEPVPGCWSVRPVAGGHEVDHVRPEPEPAPVTTIAWRTWHLAVDCLDGYSDGAFGVRALDVEGRWWVGTADEALAALDAAWATFRGAFGELDEAGLARPLGPGWGPFAEASVAALVLHAFDEVVHHGAEVALLRDLWRARPPARSGDGGR